jgi:hypothetical protein
VKKVEIRNRALSEEKTKPRIFDYVQDNDGKEFLEIKQGKLKQMVLLSDVEEQIQKARTTR